MKKIFIYLIFAFFSSLSSLCLADAGNTAQTAKIIQVNQEYSEDLSSGSDVDFFRFELLEDGNIVIKLRHTDADLVGHSNTYWRGRLYNENNIYLHAIDLQGAPNESSIQEGLSAGVYYIKIEDYFYSDGQYYIQVDYEKSDFYEKTPNEKPNAATPIKLNKDYLATLSTGSDVDYFKFKLSQDEKIGIKLKHKDMNLFGNSNTYWKGRLYDESFIELRTIKLAGSPNEISIEEDLTAGTYYIKIEDYFYSSAQYSIKIIANNQGNTPTPNNTSSVFDGAGSLVNPVQDCYGCDKDIAVMHPHSGMGSTVVFQWLHDESQCEFLDLTADSDIDVVIKSKGWDHHLIKKAFKTTLSDTPVSFRKSSGWTTFAITSTAPISQSVWVTAQCRKPNDTYYDGSKQSVAKDLVDVGADYYWMGTGSIISSAERTGFGVNFDIALVATHLNSLTSFQWLSSANCATLNITDGSLVDLNRNANVSIKTWNNREFTQECSSLPCSISKPSNYYVIKIESELDGFGATTIQAECSGSDGEFMF